MAGELRDPVSGLPIRKSLTILTTSQILVDHLHKLRCPGNHQHQVIEGSIRTKEGIMNRSTFTEHYPRKFARRIALCFRKNIVVHEHGTTLPGDFPWKDLPVLGAEAETDPSAKRRRIASQARLKKSRVADVSTLQNPKRRRCTGKTKPVESHNLWEQIFSDVFTDVPRVGKKIITDTDVLARMSPLLPSMSKRLVCAIASRGTSRTVAPPKDYTPGEIHSRIMIFMDRNDGKLLIEENWEDITHLSNRQLVRPSHEGHKSITVFACQSPAITADSPSADQRLNDDNPESPRLNPMLVPVGVQALSESQMADLENPKQPESFKALSPSEKQALIRSHKNLGHPSPERLSSLLRQQGFRAEVARAALDYQCSVCLSQQQPRLHYPATIREKLDFNDRV